MKVLIIGGDGMLGHRLLADLADHHEVGVTVHRALAGHPFASRFERVKTYDRLDVRDIEALSEVIAGYAPQAIVNAAGIVKRRKEAEQAIPSIEVNSLFPHRLAAMAADADARLLHVSTDCVFSGRRGGYRETDLPDPVDLYGMTKLVGEVTDPPSLTIRTSIVGTELTSRRGLVEWALSQTGEIKGYIKAIYTGLTTAELSRVVDMVLTDFPQFHGLWHVASQPITKYQLLVDLFSKLGRADVRVVSDAEVVCDRSLDGEPFRRATGWRPMSWDAMLDELAAEILRRKVDEPWRC